jgi:predicted ribosomally synthesized peptide with nif11-like leader
MKTIEEFIQRLQNDPEFEQRAHAFEDSDEFINFLKNEGYDFTLEQLLDTFKNEEVTDQLVTLSPGPVPGVQAFIQRLESDPEFERQAQAFENDDDFMEFAKIAGYDFTLEELTAGFKGGKAALYLGDQGSPIPNKVDAIPAPWLPDDSESLQQADPSPQGGQAQDRPRVLIPIIEGVSGGRRRGMKWRSIES